MIKDELIAKEKGFDWETEEFYTDSKKPRLSKGVGYMSDSYVRWWKWNSIPDNYPTEGKDVLCAAPTQNLLQKWIREIHKIDIIVNVTSLTNEYWGHIPGFIATEIKTKNFNTYEQALEETLFQALKLIK